MKIYFKNKSSDYKHNRNFYYRANKKNSLGKFYPIDIITTSVTSIRLII